MKITIGKFDPANATVPVIFKQEGKTHSRAVNAVLAQDGSYDRSATIRTIRMERIEPWRRFHF